MGTWLGTGSPSLPVRGGDGAARPAIPGTVGVPGEDAVIAGAVLGTGGQGHLHDPAGCPHVQAPLRRKGLAQYGSGMVLLGCGAPHGAQRSPPAPRHSSPFMVCTRRAPSSQSVLMSVPGKEVGARLVRFPRPLSWVPAHIPSWGDPRVMSSQPPKQHNGIFTAQACPIVWCPPTCSTPHLDVGDHQALHRLQVPEHLHLLHNVDARVHHHSLVDPAIPWRAEQGIQEGM